MSFRTLYKSKKANTNTNKQNKTNEENNNLDDFDPEDQAEEMLNIVLK